MDISMDIWWRDRGDGTWRQLPAIACPHDIRARIGIFTGSCRGRSSGTERRLMASLSSPRLTAAPCAASALLMLSACGATAPSDPESYLPRVESAWDIEVPESAEVREYYSSEADFHGGRDEVYVLDIPAADRTGVWDPASYAHGVPHDGAPSVSEISASAGAPITDDLLDSLRCGDPVRADQNFILFCIDGETDAFYVFEQLF